MSKINAHGYVHFAQERIGDERFGGVGTSRKDGQCAGGNWRGRNVIVGVSRVFTWGSQSKEEEVLTSSFQS